MPQPPGVTGTGWGPLREAAAGGWSLGGQQDLALPGAGGPCHGGAAPPRLLALAGGSLEGGGAAAGWDGTGRWGRGRGGGTGLQPARRVWAPLRRSRRLPGAGVAAEAGGAGPGRAGLPGRGDTLQLLRLQMQTHPIDSSEVTSAYNRAKFGCGVDGIKAHVSE